MSRDVLRDATSALRQLQLEDVDREQVREQADWTRARVMRSLHEAKRRRATKLTIAIPLAAILVGSTAWANANGKLDGLFDLVRNPVQRPVPSVLVERKIPERAPTLARAAMPQATAEQTPEAAADPAEEAAEAEPEATPAPPEPVALVEQAPEAPAPTPLGAAPEVAVQVADATPSAPRSPEPEPPPVESQADELYRVAHQAHFGARQPAAALAAWDAYLRQAPGGRFAPEAQYNRAICLVRLGRSEAARTALEAFAEGRFGGYRQAEAQALIDALAERP